MHANIKISENPTVTKNRFDSTLTTGFSIFTVTINDSNDKMQISVKKALSCV